MYFQHLYWYVNRLVVCFFFRRICGLFCNNFWEGISVRLKYSLPVPRLVDPVSLEKPTRLLVLGFKAFRASDPTPWHCVHTFVYVSIFMGNGYTSLFSLKGACNPQMAVNPCSRGCAWQNDCSDGIENILCLSLKTLWQEVLRQMKLGIH